MLTEKEFDLLVLLKEAPFIQRERFSTDDEFDFSCELARELLAKNLLITSAKEPFRKNFKGHGAQYAIAGKFSLSAPAREAVALGSYAAYIKSQPRESMNWYIDKIKNHKLLGLIVALGVIVIALGSFTESIGKISGFVRGFIDQPAQNEKISLIVTVKNARQSQVEISPFARYFLTEDKGLMIQEYEGGRLVLHGLDQSQTNIIDANQVKSYYANIPDSVANSRLMERGGGTMHVQLRWVGGSDFQLESIPLMKDTLKRYRLEFTIQPNKKIQPTANSGG